MRSYFLFRDYSDGTSFLLDYFIVALALVIGPKMLFRAPLRLQPYSLVALSSYFSSPKVIGVVRIFAPLVAGLL